MKNLTRTLFVFVMTMSIFALPLTSCGDDDDDKKTNPADKTELNALIEDCDALLATATTDEYPQSAIDAFQQAVNTAKAAATSTALTQTQVDNIVVNLTNAMTQFEKQAFSYIPDEALIIGLSFDEANAAELTTNGAHALKAVLTAGPSEIFGSDTSKPTYVEGVKGKAIHFTKGSHLEIANYTSDFLSNTMSIAVWVKPEATRGGNYIASLNFWNNWKFQVQEQNKPFFTVATTAGITDADNEAPNSAPNGEWTHLVVTLDLSKKELSFYVNGEWTKTWTSTTKDKLTGTMAPAFTNTIPFLIGAGNTYAGALEYYDWQGWNTPETWDYFIGSMDEFKIYNIALESGQISNLYNTEKTK